jgi:hypothetical protein
MKSDWMSFAIVLWSLAATLGAQPLPQTYGTAVVSYAEIPAAAFGSNNPTYPVTKIPVFLGVARYTAGCGGCLEAPLRLPSGAKLTSLEVDGIDGDAGDDFRGSLLVCDRFGLNCSQHPAAGAGPADCIDPGWICSGLNFADGPTLETADLTLDDVVVDNTQHSYLLWGSADSSSAALGGMIVGYALQVSAAPPTSDFADVPTSSPQFQFIEALYASGITAGCGSGNFCPNAPLTRGQMAVFLSKALGLQWP